MHIFWCRWQLPPGSSMAPPCRVNKKSQYPALVFQYPDLEFQDTNGFPQDLYMGRYLPMVHNST